MPKVPSKSGMSRRAYARHRGCSESAVRKAIAYERIVVEADGLIDVAKADQMWLDNTDPTQGRPLDVARPPPRRG